jgi:hypothetical protein
MTPESITPLERLLPYLLLISFSSIQFNADIISQNGGVGNRHIRQSFCFFGGKYRQRRGCMGKITKSGVVRGGDGANRTF